MQSDLTIHVHSILQHGIRLKSRLMRNEPLILENEQALLKKMLLTDHEAKRLPDYGVDEFSNPAPSDGLPRNSSQPFLGVRYALVCWLDELFLVDSLWDSRWNENKLELALYGTNDRAWRFWEQSKLSEMRPGSEVLAAFFLCVMLGFRGELRDHADQLQGWVESSRRRLLLSNERVRWTRPPELTPLTNVPPLRGRESLRRMVVSGGILMLVLIPVLAVFLVLLFAQPSGLNLGTKPPLNAPEKGEILQPEIP